MNLQFTYISLASIGFSCIRLQIFGGCDKIEMLSVLKPEQKGTVTAWILLRSSPVNSD